MFQTWEYYSYPFTDYNGKRPSLSGAQIWNGCAADSSCSASGPVAESSKQVDTKELQIFVVEKHFYTTEIYTPFTDGARTCSAMRKILAMGHR